MLDLNDPIRSGVFLSLQNARVMPFSSSASPTCKVQKLLSNKKKNLVEQSSFRKGLATEHAVLKLTDNVLKSNDQKMHLEEFFVTY